MTRSRGESVHWVRLAILPITSIDEVLNGESQRRWLIVTIHEHPEQARLGYLEHLAR